MVPHMTVILYDFGAFRLLAKHIFNKNGIWWYRRRIPSDVAKLHPNDNGERRFSLKTRDLGEATKKAHVETLRLDALWKAFRAGDIKYGPESLKAAEALLAVNGLKPGDWKTWDEIDVTPPFIDKLIDSIGVHPEDSPEEVAYKHKHGLPPTEKLAVDLFYGAERPVFLSEALAKFQDLKVEDLSSKSERDRVRVVTEFIALYGDQPIDLYTRENANEYVRYLREDRGNKPESIKRRINSIRAVFTLMESEGLLGTANIFRGVQIKGMGESVRERLPFTVEEIEALQALCLEADDDLRWAIALMSDTGMRLAEAIGLAVEDVHLEEPVPYVDIRETETRSVKTSPSIRQTPLVGASLWAARRAVGNARSGFLFSRYIDFSVSPPKHKADTASNALNAWIRRQGVDKTCHSFRHSLADRLRSVDTPDNLREAIGGWKSNGAAAGYGAGYSLAKKAEYLNKIVLSELFPADH
jgi:integrase